MTVLQDVHTRGLSVRSSELQCFISGFQVRTGAWEKNIYLLFLLFLA